MSAAVEVGIPEGDGAGGGSATRGLMVAQLAWALASTHRAGISDPEKIPNE